ncbi:MAG: trigger factor [Rickettsiales bacterium]
MQVKELESKNLKKSFQITIDENSIKSQKENELKELGKTAKIAGFRSGQIPMKILQQRYGKAVHNDVVNKVVKNSVGELISNNKFRPTITPRIDIDKDYKDEGDLSFNVELEIFPDLPELVFDDITLERKTYEVTQDDIDEAERKIAERNPVFVDMKEGSKAEKGNVVKIDFKGSVDGVAFEGGSAEDFSLELGSGQFIDNFEDQLIGSKAGDEKTVKVKFPDNYPAANLKGKQAEFAVTVKAIQEKQLPEINEEFATSRGFENLDKLHEAVRAQIIKEFDDIVRNLLKKQLFDQLEEKFDFELPESMVESEFGTIWERIEQAKNSGDEELKDKSEEELKTEYQKVARRRVALGILLAEIGSREKIQVSREEISQAVMQQASQYPGQEQQIFEFYRKNPQHIENLRGPILEEKAVDSILGKVKFNDSKVAISELVNAEYEEAAGEKAEKKDKKETETKKKTNTGKAKAKKTTDQ